MIKNVTLTLNGKQMISQVMREGEGYKVNFIYDDQVISKTCREWVDVILITQTMIMQFCLYAGVKLKLDRNTY